MTGIGCKSIFFATVSYVYQIHPDASPFFVSALTLSARLLADLCVAGGLLLPDARALRLVEDERGRARQLVRHAVHAVVELVAHVGGLVVEEAVGAVAARVDVLLGLLWKTEERHAPVKTGT